MTAPQCEHCAYDLSGIEVRGFIAQCPECGRDSDVRRVPKPEIPWWHVPRAMAAGTGTYVAVAFAGLLIHRGIVPKPTPMSRGISWTLLVLCAAMAATTAVAVLRADYLARWRYRYGPGKPPRAAWIELLEHWLVFAVVLGIAVPFALTFVLASLP